jgi:hypothetical protein
MTCWRRLKEWQEQGVWQRLHEVLLARLNAAERIDWSRAVVDSSHVRSVGGASRSVKKGAATARRSTNGTPPLTRGRIGAGVMCISRSSLESTCATGFGSDAGIAVEAGTLEQPTIVASADDAGPLGDPDKRP